MNDLLEEVEDLTSVVARKLGFIRVTHPETSAETTAATAPTAATTEEHMSLLDELHSIESKVITIGEDAFDKVATLKSTPEGALLFEAAHNIVSAVLAGHVGPTTLTGALAGLKTVEELVQGYVTAHEQAAAQAAAEAAAQQAA